MITSLIGRACNMYAMYPHIIIYLVFIYCIHNCMHSSTPMYRFTWANMLFKLHFLLFSRVLYFPWFRLQCILVHVDCCHQKYHNILKCRTTSQNISLYLIYDSFATTGQQKLAKSTKKNYILRTNCYKYFFFLASTIDLSLTIFVPHWAIALAGL